VGRKAGDAGTLLILPALAKFVMPAHVGVPIGIKKPADSSNPTKPPTELPVPPVVFRWE